MSGFAKRGSRVRLLCLSSAVLASLYALPAMAGRVDMSGLQVEQPGGYDRFIVKYRDGSTESTNATQLQRSLTNAASTGVAKRGGRALGLQKLRRLAAGGAEVVRADRKLDRVEAESLMRQLAADPNVEFVEVDQRMYAVLTPNGTRFSEQWGFGTTAAGINVQPAWDKSTGAGVVVAVIDTGITSHADLNANLLPGYDFISDTFVSRDGDHLPLRQGLRG